MNQRRDSTSRQPIAIAIGVVVILVLAAIYWFAIRDDGNKSPSGGTPTGAPTTVGPLPDQAFNKPGLPFTFKYPGNFAETTGPAGFVWIAGVGPYDILDIKRLANKPTTVARLRSNNQQALSARPDLTILSQGSDKRANVDMVTFVVKSTVNGLSLRSTLYYFSLGNVTWQFECESQAHRKTIDAACAQALSTFAVVS